jgi:CDP-glucose 4,6-dehydratase
MQGGTASPNRGFWNGRRVLVVGNTGFKGSWLSLWLHRLGARVAGLALPPPTEPSLFALAGLAELVPTSFGDIRDLDTVLGTVRSLRPEVVFHLAAQSLVRLSYRRPVETYATNVLGTVHVLEAIRSAPTVRSVIVVSSDKCYENRDWPWPYRETDAMGGHDPYSSSKGCAELVTAAYRRSYFSAPDNRAVGVATVRAGNVIGGGDWAEDRLLPDCLSALGAGEAVAIRNPHAVRPWQYVLEPLCGYLTLAERLDADAAGFGDAWNFGPADQEAQSVAWIASRIAERWGDGATWFHASGDAPHEAAALKVDASRARMRLGWAPRLRLEDALAWTVEWHRRLAAGEAALALTDRQIARYGELGA